MKHPWRTDRVECEDQCMDKTMSWIMMLQLLNQMQDTYQHRVERDHSVWGKLLRRKSAVNTGVTQPWTTQRLTREKEDEWSS